MFCCLSVGTCYYFWGVFCLVAATTWLWLKIKRSEGQTAGLVHVSTYQGNPFWESIFDPQPYGGVPLQVTNPHYSQGHPPLKKGGLFIRGQHEPQPHVAPIASLQVPAEPGALRLVASGLPGRAAAPARSPKSGAVFFFGRHPLAWL